MYTTMSMSITYSDALVYVLSEYYLLFLDNSSIGSSSSIIYMEEGHSPISMVVVSFICERVTLQYILR